MFECRRKKKFKLAVKILEPQELQLPFVKRERIMRGLGGENCLEEGIIMIKELKRGKKVQDIIF